MSSVIETKKPILEDLSTPPSASKTDLYRWCDYVEIRCLTHVDKRFSRDALVEALSESEDMSHSSEPVQDDNDLPTEVVDSGAELHSDEKYTTYAADYFTHLRLRSNAFGAAWPFILDEHANEIKVKKNLNADHNFYIQLLLSSLLSYCPKKRWRDLTGKFERISLEIFKSLMPKGAEVHAFGAAESSRFTGHLFDRITKLAGDLQGKVLVEKGHFKSHDSGDGGLDLVAWHSLGDTRKAMPIALAQCGCTADGWPNKMLEASPASFGTKIHVHHKWATYYFMPLDLTTTINGKMDWQSFSDFNEAIVIDRLRFVRLASTFDLLSNGLFDVILVAEVTSMKFT